MACSRLIPRTLQRAAILLAALACCRDGLRAAGGPASLPESDNEILSLPADATVADIATVVDACLRDTAGKEPDNWRFVNVRAMDRHDPEWPNSAFHVVVGAGVGLPAGSLRLRRQWSSAGQVDGSNEQLETYGIAVAVERGAPRPFTPEVVRAVTRFCQAVAPRIKLAPENVVSMQEVPYAREHSVGPDERRLVEEVRQSLDVPPPDGKLTLVSGEKRMPVTYTLRDTNTGRQVGMMLRRSFDRPDHGMLFVYPFRAQRNFYMRNCFIPLDLAYVKYGRIEQIYTMPPQAGVPEQDIRRFESNTAIRFVLEFPAGFFEKNGIKVGDTVEGLPE